MKQVIGLNGQPCIGPCLPKDSTILHPIYLFPITDHDHNPFCPTLQWLPKEGSDGSRQEHDVCTAEQVKTDKGRFSDKDMELIYGVPNFGFDCAHFLKNYYDIYSFESVIDWLNPNSESSNNNNNMITQLRIVNCAITAFGSKDILNDQIIDFYGRIIRKVWIQDIYKVVNSYISIDKSNNIYLGKPNNKDNKDNKIIKVNFIIDKFANRSTIYNVLNQFQERISNKKINNFNEELKKYYIEYVIDKIKTTLAKK
ncbi:MAG: hypothetical protein Barrevirus5_20 [Barrevirus sp.]|uniref:Uncharacterized protein n=1 Tax=Barrevirus sp. TaxID=2487763 RepID=A0A3G4ZSI3_9VIRU|nr:MAG: hypothetical protein Barrevirus5_20 [Barrevirus sp.]